MGDDETARKRRPVFAFFFPVWSRIDNAFSHGFLLGGSSHDGRIRGDHNHGDRFRPLKHRVVVVGPLPNGLKFMAYKWG